MRRFRLMLFLAWSTMGCQVNAASMDLEPLLKALQSVGPNGAGNHEASRAWQQVVKADAEHLPVVLAAMDHAGPLGLNWVRTAVDAIAERQVRSGGQLPTAALETFVKDTAHHPRARRTAYEWLLRADPKAERLLRGMLDDPSLELRHDAVAHVIGEADQVAKLGDREKAIPLYRRALTAARDHDQIKLLAERLRKLGQAIDLPRHYGFIIRWKLIGPFDNTNEKGFDVAYPPEGSIDFGASHPGKHGPVAWVDYRSSDDYGLIDFHQAFTEEKGVVGYAAAEFTSPKRQDVELRLTSYDATKLWVNGKLVGRYKIYHSGSQLDQYTAGATLQPGRNVILVKVCQNEQTQSWTRHWDFKLRVCDGLGTAILSADRDKSSPSN